VHIVPQQLMNQCGLDQGMERTSEKMKY
jgi:hypothetical protein